MPIYFAMTAAEIAGCPALPTHMGWLACHFSPSGPGISNIPQNLPPHSVLILDDSTPFSGHNADVIIGQMQQIVSALQSDAVLLDFQRPANPPMQNLAFGLSQKLPCPVAVPWNYGELDCPVFLPPCPPNQLLKDYIFPYRKREIWLEIALDGMEMAVTSTGCIQKSHDQKPKALPHKDASLHCHYGIDITENAVKFTLQRTWEDLHALTEEAGHLGITNAIGLWQELKK